MRLKLSLLFFLRNLSLLFKRDLSKEFVEKRYINLYLDSLLCEIGDLNVRKPKISDAACTIEKIILEKVSIARFGDGEFELLLNRSIPFQKADVTMQRRLKEVIESDNDKVLIGIPHMYWNSLTNYNNRIKDFVRSEISLVRKEYQSFIKFDKSYYSTEFTQMYMLYEDGVYFSEYFSSIQKIWQDRAITIIHGRGIFKNIDFNIFENAKDIKYIEAPAKDAFDNYEEIKNEALKIDKARLILIILGPTATILAYDLACFGYQALDIGHTAKDFDYYKKQIKKNEENLHDFFSPD